MTQAPFWTFESRELYNWKKSEDWQQKTRQDALAVLMQRKTMKAGMPESYQPLSTDNTFYKPKITPDDLNAVVKPQGGDAGSKGGIFGLGGITNIAKPLFGGSIDQPWDFLRPVQRVFDAEQKYFAAPIARTALKPFGVDYDKLSPFWKSLATTTLDPLTYIGPGAVMDVAKGLRFAPELKMAAPMLETLFTAPGSKRALVSVLKSGGIATAGVLGAEAANKLGAPPIIGGIIGQAAAEHGIGHFQGTEGFKSDVYVQPDYSEPRAYSNGHLKSHYQGFELAGDTPSDPKAVTFFDPEKYGKIGMTLWSRPAQVEDLSNGKYKLHPVYEISMSRHDATQTYMSGRNPIGSDVKGLLNIHAVLSDLVDNNPDVEFVAHPTDARRSKIYQDVGFDPAPNSEIRYHYGTDPDGFVSVTQAPTPWHGELVLNRDKFNDRRDSLNHPARLTGKGSSIIGDETSIPADAFESPRPEEVKFHTAMVDPSSPEMQRVLKSEEEALKYLDMPISSQMRGGATRRLRNQLGDSITREEAIKEATALHEKINQGTATFEEVTRAEALVRNFIPGIGGGAPNATAMDQLLVRLATAPEDMFGAKSIDEALAAAEAKKNAITDIRQNLGKLLPQSVVDWSRKHNIRLVDSGVTPFIDEHQLKRRLGPSYGAVVTNENRAILENEKSGITSRLAPGDGTIVTNPELITQAKQIMVDHPELYLIDPKGRLFLDDLMENHTLFNLTPEQANTLKSLDDTMGVHRAFETLFDVKGAPDRTTNGYQVHRQLISSPVKGDLNEAVQLDSGPIVAERYGALQPFQRPLSESSHAAGVANGNKYLPFEEAQGARVAQGYRAMADKWLESALEGIGKAPTDLVPQELHDQVKELGVDLRRASDLKREITRAKQTGYKNAFIAPKWITSNPELNSIIDEVKLAAATGKKELRNPQYDHALSRLEDATKQLTDAHTPLKARRKELLDQVKLSKGNPDRANYPIEFHGKYYPLSIGQELQTIDRSRSSDGIMRVVNELNDHIRPVMATLDVSFLGVQGLIAAFSNPISYIKAAHTIFANGFGDYEASLKRSGALQQMINSGMHWAARNDFSEFIAPSLIQRIPGIGPVSTLSNSMFSHFGNVLRAEMFKAGWKTNMSKLEMEGLARNVNLVSGFSSSDPSSFEKALTFAPRFMRSQLGLVADAVTKHDLSRAGAARSLSVFLTSGVALTYLANQALGQDTDFNPDSSNFLRIRFGDKDYSVFGTWDTLARGISKLVLDGPVPAAEYMARVKASPVIGRMMDLIQGESLNGQTFNWDSPTHIIESAGKYASGFLPISAQTLITEPPDFRDPKSIAGSAANFLGTKSTPLSPSERLTIKREAMAKQDYNQPYDSLEPYQKDQLRQKYNLDLPSKTEISKAFDFRAAISSRFQTQQQQLDDMLPVGRDWIDAYHNLNREKIGAYAQWAEEHPEAVAAMRHSKPKDANEAALNKFMQLFDTANQENWTPEELSTSIQGFQDSLSDTQQAYIDRNTGLHDTARVTEYKQDQRVLSDYWNLGDNVWNRLRGRIPGASQFTSMQDYTNDTISQLQEKGVSDKVIAMRIQQNPILKEVDKATSTLRNRYRHAHPAADKLLVKWYGYTPIGRGG